MKNLNKSLENINNKNKVEKIRIIKNDKLKEEELDDFYKYLRKKNIMLVENVEEAFKIFNIRKKFTFNNSRFIILYTIMK